MSTKFFHFTLALIGMGVLMALAVAYNLEAHGLHRFPRDPGRSMGLADPRRGRQAIIRHGCGACHVIPQVRGAHGRVGPKLEDFRQQMYIGGILMNTTPNLVHWIQNPQEVQPGSAMPNLGVTEQEARDIAAFLYTVP